MNTLRRTIPILAVLSVATAAITGYLGDWLTGRPTGWGLLVHLAAAPLVMLAFTAAALVWGRAHRFDRDQAGISPVRKLLFWMLMLCVWVNMTVMLAAMLPVFGYVGQDRLADAHEWSGYGLLASGALYLVLRFASTRDGRESHDAS